MVLTKTESLSFSYRNISFELNPWMCERTMFVLGTSIITLVTRWIHPSEVWTNSGINFKNQRVGEKRNITLGAMLIGCQDWSRDYQGVHFVTFQLSHWLAFRMSIISFFFYRRVTEGFYTCLIARAQSNSFIYCKLLKSSSSSKFQWPNRKFSSFGKSTMIWNRK